MTARITDHTIIAFPDAIKLLRLQETALRAALNFLDNGDSPGDCDGRYYARCAAIRSTKAALNPT